MTMTTKDGQDVTMTTEVSASRRLRQELVDDALIDQLVLSAPEHRLSGSTDQPAGGLAFRQRPWGGMTADR